MCLSASVTIQDAQPSEYDLKAAYLLNFTKFIDWPEEDVSAAQKIITIGIVGSDPFGDSIKKIEDKKVKDRTIVIKRFAGAKSIELSEILFVPESEKGNFPEILRNIKSKSTLVVCEHSDAAEHGAAIGFYIENKKLRFEINTDITGARGLKVSSQLLKLAKIIKSPEATKPAAETRPSAASRPAGGKGDD